MINSAPYYYLLFICLLLLLIKKMSKGFFNSLATIALCAVLILFSGLRFKVGADYENYVFWWRDLASASYNIKVEPGHYLIVLFTHSIGAGYQLQFLIYSFFTILLIALFIEKNSINKELSWLIFICIGPFYISTFNGMRQWLAVSLFAFSLIYVKKGQFSKYLIINLVATCFHYSSIIMIPVYFILKAKKNGLPIILLMFISIFALSNLGIVGNLMSSFGAGEFSDIGKNTRMDFSYSVFLILAIGVYIFFKLFKDKEKKDDLVYRNLNLMSGLMVACGFFISSISNMVFVRFNTYFFIGYLILIPYIINVMKGQKRIVAALVTCASILYFLIIVSNNPTITPYQINPNFLGR